MNLLTNVDRAALALFCFVVTGWSASITYPNQAYIFSGGRFSAVPGMFNVRAIAVEGEMVMAATQDGRVVTYGVPEHWLEDGSLQLLTNVVAVGLNHTMAAALTADGRVIEVARSTFPSQPPDLTNVVAIDVAGQAYDDDLDYKVAVTSDGRVAVWGYFTYPPPADIPGVVTAAGGWSHIAALKSDGTVVQWDMFNEPEVVGGLDNVVAVAAGGTHSVALKADGTVVAWGDNSYGQLNIPEGLSNVVAITASENHTLALKSDGMLAAWGRTYFGASITPPANLSNVVAIASSGTRNLAIVSLPLQRPVLGIAGPTSNAGRLTVSLSGEPNRVYTIEASADLLHWDFLRFVTNETESATFEVEYTKADEQFYRAQ